MTSRLSAHIAIRQFSLATEDRTSRSSGGNLRSQTEAERTSRNAKGVDDAWGYGYIALRDATGEIKVEHHRGVSRIVNRAVRLGHSL